MEGAFSAGDTRQSGTDAGIVDSLQPGEHLILVQFVLAFEGGQQLVQMAAGTRSADDVM